MKERDPEEPSSGLALRAIIGIFAVPTRQYETGEFLR